MSVKQQTTTKQTSSEPQTTSVIQTALLVCGIVYALFYVGLTDILAGILWDSYRFASQSVSELSAIGAPTRPLLIALHSVDTPLIIAFGLGVFGVAGRRRGLRVTGILLAVYGVVGYVFGVLLFPMHLRGQLAPNDSMHLVQQSVVVLSILLAIGFGAGASGMGFRVYSILTILVMLIFGAWGGAQAPLVAANLPTPWMGLIERMCAYPAMLWMLVLAVVLLRASNGRASLAR